MLPLDKYEASIGRKYRSPDSDHPLPEFNCDRFQREEKETKDIEEEEEDQKEEWEQKEEWDKEEEDIQDEEERST